MQQHTKKTLHFRKITGKKLNELRISRTGLSGNEFANQFDIGNSNVSRIDNGIVDAKFVTLWEICEALDIKFSEFAKLLEDELGEDFKLIDE